MHNPLRTFEATSVLDEGGDKAVFGVMLDKIVVGEVVCSVICDLGCQPA